MKNTILFILIFITAICCKAQIYPLTTYTDVPANAYIKDLNNELLPYEGTWMGQWDNKVFTVNLKKIKKNYTYIENNPYYKDILIAKFKVVNPNGLILFDNTNISDDNAKIQGGRFILYGSKYVLTYDDTTFCMHGSIRINFTNSTQTKLNWQFSDMTDIITPDCPYYNANPFPQPLPKNIILNKQ